MDPRPLGIFDSGVGGLTVFRELASALPGESFVYLGDTARVPYGTRSAETVVRYSVEAARFLRERDIKMLVVACNTASSVAMEAMAEEARVPVTGVILPGARRAVERSASHRIGVIGTRATIGSRAYREAILALRPRAEVTGRACPLFVPLAEEGWAESDVARRVAEIYLSPLRRAGVDTLVLGCTHYPLLKPVIAEVMGNGVSLVDSAEAVAIEVREWLGRDGALSAGSRRPEGETHFFVTDAPESFADVAERFLGQPVLTLERARL